MLPPIPHRTNGMRIASVPSRDASKSAVKKYNYNIIMMQRISFEWDELKNRENYKKHGLVFEEAATAFGDENARIIADPDHSDNEDRFILVGLTRSMNLVVVCHCYRRHGQVIRLISARLANKWEKAVYREYLI